MRDVLLALATNSGLAGADPHVYWKNANFLRIESRGNSQRVMLTLFGQILKQTFNVNLEDCGSDKGPYFYFDDVVFTGSHFKSDLIRWLKSKGPPEMRIIVVVIAYHSQGQFFASKDVTKAAEKAEKHVKITWCRRLVIEDRKAYRDKWDVLRPSRLPDDELTEEYVRDLEQSGHPPILRKTGSLGRNQFFSSEESRDLLEQEFLKAGLKIRSANPNLNECQRPLGLMFFPSLGFGSVIVTYRNCPNNCPLAFWVDYPWFPLFPRKANT